MIREQLSTTASDPLFALNKSPAAAAQGYASPCHGIWDPERPRQEEAVWEELIDAFLFEWTCILHVGTLLSLLIDSNSFIG